jgi:glycosyltransferase involved in cell wall biosynthesis
MNKGPVLVPRIWLVSGEIMSQLGGGHRQQRWCEFFLNRNVPVLIFFAQGLRTFAIAEAKTSAMLRQMRINWIAKSPPKAGVRTGFFAAVGRWMKHLFLLDLFLPSQWILYRHLARHLDVSQGRVALLCSSPPFALAFVCALIKWRYGKLVFFSLDMRDLWSLHTAHPGPKWHKELIEGWVMKQVDMLTTVSEGLSRRFDEAFGARALVAYNVATHVESDASSDARGISWSTVHPLLSESTFKFIYTGSLPRGYYDLESFASALQQAKANIQDKQFVFVGACEELKSLVRQLSVPPELIVFVDQVDISTAQRIQRAADALIFFGFIAPDNQGQVSIKLFEYMRNRKPILALNIKDGSDVDVLLKLYCGRGYLLTSPEEIGNTLSLPGAECLAGLPVPNNGAADTALLRPYDAAVQTILDELEVCV